MLFFNKRLADEADHCNAKAQRLEQLAGLQADLNSAFPSITFRLELGSNLINAQAVTTAAGRHVNIYGGLAYNRRLSTHSLTLILLHEAGHHLSRGCRLPWNPLLACECAADSWSVNEGIELLCSRKPEMKFGLQQAIRELNPLLSGKTSGSRHTARFSPCWSLNWSARKSALLRREKFDLAICPQS
jgi:hypothetical protein